MKKSFFAFLLSLVFSCSSDEEIQPSTNTDQTTIPESVIPINTTDVINDPEIFNYDKNTDYTEQIVDFYPNAFFASDLSENVVNGINLALKTAAD